MSKWIEVATLQELGPGERKCTRADGVPVAVFNIDGKLHAVHNVCPHAGLPLGDGELAGMTLTCPFHGYTFNLKNGKNVDFEGDAPLRLYPVKVDGPNVLVDVEPEASQESSSSADA